jgi:hypothetical protein
MSVLVVPALALALALALVTFLECIVLYWFVEGS